MNKFNFLNEKFVLKEHNLLETAKKEDTKFKFLIETNSYGDKIVSIGKKKLIAFVRETCDIKQYTNDKGIFDYKNYFSSRPKGFIKTIIESYLKKK